MDYDYVLEYPEHLSAIESHNEFRGWKAKCPDCWSLEEHCDCEGAEYINNDDDDVAKYGGWVFT